jgi:hypothetical protein
VILVLAAAGAAIAGDTPPGTSSATNPPSLLISPEDGRLDLSAFLDKSYGFIPLVIPITEPAVGYGAAVFLAFIDKPMQSETEDGYGRPDILGAGGLATANGSWGVGAFDLRNWLDERLKTQVALVYASLNFDFFGLGDNPALRDRSLGYNLEPLGGMASAKYRIGNSSFWAGLGYVFASTEVTFDAPPGTPGLPFPFQGMSRVGGLTPSITFDSRDNMFTATRGTYVDLSPGLYSQAFGGTSEFQRVDLTAIHYLPLDPKLTLGVRGGAAASYGDVPFYMRPYIALRGAPIMRYQGDQVAEVEAEVRWQFWQRFSLVGFAGTGAAWNGSTRFDNPLTVVTGGFGFRYELARKYGLHMGLDLAFGPPGPALYVQFGSAWMRP